jgi:hypothetical protein
LRSDSFLFWGTVRHQLLDKLALITISLFLHVGENGHPECHDERSDFQLSTFISK